MPGWVALIAAGTVYDWYAIKSRRAQTLSAAGWHLRDHHGWAFGALMGAIIGHFLLDGRKSATE